MKHGDLITLTAAMQPSSEMHIGCEVEYKGVNSSGTISFYCPTHQQWVYVFRTGYTNHYAGGLPDIRR